MARTLSGLTEGIFDSLHIYETLEVEGQTEFGSLAVSGALTAGALTCSSLQVGPGQTLLQGAVSGSANSWSVDSGDALLATSVRVGVWRNTGQLADGNRSPNQPWQVWQPCRSRRSSRFGQIG